MSRLKAFLPLMKQANDELALRVQQDPNFGGFEIVDEADSEEDGEYDDDEDPEFDDDEEGEDGAIESKVIQMVRSLNFAVRDASAFAFTNSRYHEGFAACSRYE